MRARSLGFWYFSRIVSSLNTRFMTGQFPGKYFIVLYSVFPLWIIQILALKKPERTLWLLIHVGLMEESSPLHPLIMFMEFMIEKESTSARNRQLWKSIILNLTGKNTIVSSRASPGRKPPEELVIILIESGESEESNKAPLRELWRLPVVRRLPVLTCLMLEFHWWGGQEYKWMKLFPSEILLSGSCKPEGLRLLPRCAGRAGQGMGC